MDGRRLSLAALLLATSFAVGCGGDSGAPAPQAQGSATAKPVPAEPDRVVYEFLESIRTGNDDRATQMLTETARRETAKHDLVVAPPGSDTARFTVGQTEFVIKDQLVHVATQWTDTGEDGQPHTDDIIWALRRDGNGWRIAGMAAKVFDGEPPLLLDFENPEDMIEKQRLAEQELQRRAAATAEGPAANTAQKPAPPAQQGPTGTPRSSNGNVLRQ